MLGSNTSAAGGPQAPPAAGEFGPLELVLVAVLISLILISVVGNCLVCVAIFTDRRLRKLGNAFIVSLAIADLFVSCLVMTFALCNDLMNYWMFGDWFCDVWISFDIMCCTASILNLCAISLDRFIHIKDCLLYNQWMTRRVALSAVLAIWIISALVSFVPINLGWHKPEHQFGGGGSNARAAGLQFASQPELAAEWQSAAPLNLAAWTARDPAPALPRLDAAAAADDDHDNNSDSNSIRVPGNQVLEGLSAAPAGRPASQQPADKLNYSPTPRGRRNSRTMGHADDEGPREAAPIEKQLPPESIGWRARRAAAAASTATPTPANPTPRRNNKATRAGPAERRGPAPADWANSARGGGQKTGAHFVGAGAAASGPAAAAGRDSSGPADNQRGPRDVASRAKMNNFDRRAVGAGNDRPPSGAKLNPLEAATTETAVAGTRQSLFNTIGADRFELARARRRPIREGARERPSSGPRAPPTNDQDQQQRQQAPPQCMLTLTPTYAVVSSTISFYIPCLIMLGLYSKLFACARRHVKNIRATSKAPAPIGAPTTPAAAESSVANQRPAARKRRLDFLARGRKAAPDESRPQSRDNNNNNNNNDDVDVDDEDTPQQSSFSCATTGAHATDASTGCGATSGASSGASAQQVAGGNPLAPALSNSTTNGAQGTARLDTQRRHGRARRRLWFAGGSSAGCRGGGGEQAQTRLAETGRTWIKFGRARGKTSGGDPQANKSVPAAARCEPAPGPPELRLDDGEHDGRTVIDKQNCSRQPSGAQWRSCSDAPNSAPLIDAEADEKLAEVIRRLDDDEQQQQQDNGLPRAPIALGKTAGELETTTTTSSATAAAAASWREDEPFLAAKSGRGAAPAPRNTIAPNAGLATLARQQNANDTLGAPGEQRAHSTEAAPTAPGRPQKSITFKLNLGGTKISNKLNHNGGSGASGRKSWLAGKGAKQAPAAACATSTAERQHSQLATHKAAVTLGIIMGTFLFCWVPFFCINIIKALCVDCVPSSAFRFFTWLGYANSALNPIIYGIHNSEFRNAFNRIFFKHLSIKTGRQYLNRRFSYDLRQTSAAHRRSQQQQHPLVAKRQAPPEPRRIQDDFRAAPSSPSGKTGAG